jgi:nitroreductase
MGIVYDLIVRRRTIRRFQQKPIDRDILERMVNAARLAPSGMNLQPLEFVVVDEPELREAVFPTTSWAGYIAPRGTPAEGERPVAYILVLINRQIKKFGGQHDVGAAMMNMILTALEEGIGTCWIASLERESLADLLKIPKYLEIDSLLALGYPAEQPVVEKFQGSVQYWKDDQGILHVPKRALEDVIHWNGYGKH